MLPPQVTQVNVSDGWNTDPGHSPYRVKKVVWYAGTQGPFTLQYGLADFTTEKVQADISAAVTTLQGIGALPTGTPGN